VEHSHKCLTGAPLLEKSPLQEVSLASLLGLFLAWEREELLFWFSFFLLFGLWLFRRKGILFLFAFFLAFVYGDFRFSPPAVLKEFPWGKKVRFEAEVIRPPLRLPSYTRLEVKLRRIYAPEPQRIDLKARLYLPPSVDLHVGEVFQATARWRRPRGFRNPFGYDARRYAETKGIYLVGSLSRKECPQILFRRQGLRLQKIREKLFDFASRLPGPSRGLFEALDLERRRRFPRNFVAPSIISGSLTFWRSPVFTWPFLPGWSFSW